MLLESSIIPSIESSRQSILPASYPFSASPLFTTHHRFIHLWRGGGESQKLGRLSHSREEETRKKGRFRKLGGSGVHGGGHRRCVSGSGVHGSGHRRCQRHLQGETAPVSHAGRRNKEEKRLRWFGSRRRHRRW
ncbi:hypothetical protein DEO72_LG2g1889 [Vigna unguiculata]|uniref:Uncharacterized protein n=1 Tax=Vigna unguiculata TaxID=3917 RepID=A0A4D6KXD2_VIGUN|nr:hypothetical protein DEO72_LG2g1889 [Vigna unguiculata]